MFNVSGFLRKALPGFALGGIAIAIVALLDPALAKRSEGNATVAALEPQSADAAVPASAPESCSTAPEVTGPSVTTRWGPVQVAASFANGELCEVHAIAYPYGDNHSARISDQVIPYLDAQATQVGTQFDSISGATYTTEGYRQSLQALLDSVRA